MHRFALAFAALVFSAAAGAADRWVEGTHYAKIEPAQPVDAPAGKVEVVEVFSYGCSHCNEFLPIMENLKKGLPANAQMRYLPATFGRDAWTTFARAYYAAEAMGILDKTHPALFKAIWTDRKIEPTSPKLEDIAALYASVAGVKAEDVIATANSFAINAKIKRGEAYIKNTGVDGTPALIVGGKYRFSGATAGSFGAIGELLNYLVALDGGK